MNFAYIAAGVLLLIMGRKLFWLFVAIVGFLVGLTYIPEILPGQPDSVILAVSLIAGLFGALLAILLQKFAVALAGLAAGGYVTHYLLQMITLDVGQYQWLAIAAGALVGAAMAGSMYDWALVILTSGSGAALITQYLSIEMPFSAVLFAGLTIFGIIAQARMRIKE